MSNFIIREPIWFFSQLDEDNFFGWLQRIPVVSGVKGGPGLKIALKEEKIDNQSVQEFAALFVRYNLNAEVLGSVHKGKVSLDEKVNPQSVILTDRPSNGFSLSLNPVFVSPLDERGFDNWLKEIRPNYAGLDSRKTAVLELSSDDVDIMNVSDLIAVCRRYRLYLPKLRRLCEVADYDYFREKWDEEIFGPQSSS